MLVNDRRTSLDSIGPNLINSENYIRDMKDGLLLQIRFQVVTPYLSHALKTQFVELYDGSNLTAQTFYLFVLVFFFFFFLYSLISYGKKAYTPSQVKSSFSNSSRVQNVEMVGTTKIDWNQNLVLHQLAQKKGFSHLNEKYVSDLLMKNGEEGQAHWVHFWKRVTIYILCKENLYINEVCFRN